MKTIFTILLLIFSSISVAQSIVEDLSNAPSQRTYELVEEKILKVSISRRIFLITNQQDSFARGDFITFLIDKKPIARGLAAKILNRTSAIKITKIYSLQLFNSLAPGMTIQVIRGDDSYYTQSPKEKDEDISSLIDDEEDLYDETTILDGEDLESNKKEVIKNDNVVSVGAALVDGKDEAGDDAKNTQLFITWAYQLDSNIFIEGLYGQHIIKDFPDAGVDTQVTNLTFRAKYAFKGPLYSVVKPYIGVAMISADSPGAEGSEIDEVAELDERGLVFGVTLLKRLVPGWFIRGDLGNDMMSLGLALEF